ncbi:MAG: MATE family efflux transporter, partial [Pseudomonadota bacterium]
GVIFALSGAVGPIIGQNYGAKDHARVRRAFWDALIFTGIVVVAISVALFFLRGPIVALFSATGITAELVILFCGPLALAFFFNGMIFVGNAAFNNLGHPYYSTWINWGRHTVGTIVPVLIFGAWFGAAGVLIGQSVGGLLFGVISIWLGLRVMNERGGTVEREPFARQARLFQLLNHRR